MKDEFYNKHLIKNSVFKPILQMLSETERRNNLPNSACLELFVFIRVENIKSLIVHIVSNYREILESFNYVNVFELLIARYEQYQESSESANNNDIANKTSTTSTKVNDWGKADEEEEAYFNDDDEDDEDTLIDTEKNTEDPNKIKSEKSSNPKIALANSVSGPSRGRIANPNAIVARFIRSTQPLASGLVDYPDDDDIIEEEEEDDEDMMPKLNTKTELDTKTESTSILFSKNKSSKENEDKTKDNKSNNNGTTTSANKYSLPNSKIRKIEFVSTDKKDKDNENKKTTSSPTKTITNNKMIDEDKEMTSDNLGNKNNNKRSREEDDTNNDEEPLPIRKKINKEDDDELFLQSINKNKLRKEASKLNSNEKSPLNSKKITLNISPKLKHTDINQALNSTSSISSSPSPSPSSPIKKLDSNSMDEDEKEPSNISTENDKSKDSKKKVDIIIHPNIKNNLKKS
jgi:protein phosphatase-4 regulatory subunit 3